MKDKSQTDWPWPTTESMAKAQDIVDNLRTRAKIRRSIPRAKDGKPDRISDVCEQAADEIVTLRDLVKTLQEQLSNC